MYTTDAIGEKTEIESFICDCVEIKAGEKLTVSWIPEVLEKLKSTSIFGSLDEIRIGLETTINARCAINRDFYKIHGIAKDYLDFTILRIPLYNHQFRQLGLIF